LERLELGFNQTSYLISDLVKKIAGSVFLSVLLMQVAGGYVYFIVRLSGIRQEMRAELALKPDEQLTLLTLSDDEYRKAKINDHEVKVNEKMYDVARISVKDGKVLVYALHDEAEDSLLALLNEIVKRSSNDKKPIPSSLLGLMHIIYLTQECIVPLAASVRERANTAYQFFSTDTVDTIISPPPQSIPYLILSS